tara:strand:+ start:272 stop:952 length:681 start_codon:yes stop_codon:yes gene_type:complete
MIKNKILIIAPHPDDEVLGCGGAIAKYAELGNEVYLCIGTKAYTPDWSEEFIKNRKTEIKKSNKILKIKKTYFLDFPTVKLDTVPQKQINDKLTKIFEKVRPDLLFIPHGGDLNKDHRILFESSLVAARPISHKIKKIASYEVLSETEWGGPIQEFKPNFYIGMSLLNLNKKIEAMMPFESEVKKYPHPRSKEIIKALAQKRGSEAGLEFAEAFSIIRETENEAEF